MKKLLTCIVIIFSLIGLIGTAFASKAQQNSLGISPSYITSEILRPGNTYTQEFVLSRSNPETDATAIVEVDAPAPLDSWITLNDGNEIAMPAGQQRVEFSISVNVPEDATITDYNGFIRVRLSNNEASNVQVALLPGVRIDVRLDLSNEIIKKLEILSASVPTFPINNTLNMVLKVDNQGNVPDAPQRAVLRVLSLQEEEVALLTTEAISDVPAFSQSEVNAIFSNHGLTESSYLAEVEIFYEDKIIYEDRLAFDVTEQSVVAETGEKIIQTVENAPLLAKVALAVGTILTLGSITTAFILFLKRRKQRKEKSYVV